LIALLCCFSGRVGGSGGGGSGGGRGDVFRADSGGFDFDGAARRAGLQMGSIHQVCEIRIRKQALPIVLKGIVRYLGHQAVWRVRRLQW